MVKKEKKFKEEILKETGFVDKVLDIAEIVFMFML